MQVQKKNFTHLLLAQVYQFPKCCFHRWTNYHQYIFLICFHTIFIEINWNRLQFTWKHTCKLETTRDCCTTPTGVGTTYVTCTKSVQKQRISVWFLLIPPHQCIMLLLCRLKRFAVYSYLVILWLVQSCGPLPVSEWNKIEHNTTAHYANK